LGVAASIRGIARGIGGTKERDRAGVQSRRKVQRSCVAADDAYGASQESHQLSEIATVDKRARIPACVNQCCYQIIFTGADVNDAAQP
jgi:hypothetical protein